MGYTIKKMNDTYQVSHTQKNIKSENKSLIEALRDFFAKLKQIKK